LTTDYYEIILFNDKQLKFTHMQMDVYDIFASMTKCFSLQVNCFRYWDESHFVKDWMAVFIPNGLNVLSFRLANHGM